MEHRWGERQRLNIDVQISPAGSLVAQSGQLVNLSMSGALIIADGYVRLLSRILVVFAADGAPRETTGVARYVTRQHANSIGVAWCEMTPPAVAFLIKAAIQQRARIRETM